METHRNFPRTVARVFQHRRRALHLFGAEFEAECLLDTDSHGATIERGETMLQLRVDGRSVLVRAHVWPDHWVWIDARHSVKGGWRWTFCAEGRFLPTPGARGIVTNIEKMLRAAHLPAAQVPDAMSAIWRRTLAAGPSRLP